MQTYKYVTFNGPDPIASDGTYPSAINQEGKVIGSVFENFHTHTAFQYDHGTLTSVAPAGASTSDALGINANGVIVGDYVGNGGEHGFIDDHGVYTTLDAPGVDTEAVAINNRGVIAGTTEDNSFIYNHGTYTTLADPAGTYTQATSINDRGEVAGTFILNGGSEAYFLYDKGIYTTITPPGGKGGFPGGFSIGDVNDRGQFVGTFFGSSSNEMGFIYDHGTYTTLAAPDATSTIAIGINNRGEVVGFDTNNTSEHGFVYANGKFTNIDVPSATEETIPQAINDRGQVTGTYYDSTGAHGFIATPQNDCKGWSSL